MSLLTAIENLQQSSVTRRKLVLVISVSVIMALVIAVWILQLRYPLDSIDSAASIKAPFELLWNTTWENIKSGIPNGN